MLIETDTIGFTYCPEDRKSVGTVRNKGTGSYTNLLVNVIINNSTKLLLEQQ